MVVCIRFKFMLRILIIQDIKLDIKMCDVLVGTCLWGLTFLVDHPHVGRNLVVKVLRLRARGVGEDLHGSHEAHGNRLSKRRGSGEEMRVVGV